MRSDGRGHHRGGGLECVSGLIGLAIAAKQIIADGMTVTVGNGLESNSLVQYRHIHEIGLPEVLRIENLDVGEPGPGEMRVRVQAIGLNRADINFRSGHYLEPAKLPARRATKRQASLRSSAKG